jgi:uncharacterized protein
MMALERFISKTVVENLQHFPAVALLGPRQVGKTTLAKAIAQKLERESIYLDLESLADLQKLENAEDYLRQREDKLIILDEIQRLPSLFPLLRSVIDRKRENGRFILLGSASPEILAKSSETLAGRIAYLELHPFSYQEIKNVSTYQNLWLKGGFPAMFLQVNEEVSFESRIQFIQTYIERELPLLGLSASPTVLRNLLRMIGHINGNLVNYSDLSRSLGVDIGTIKRYIDYFENAFLIRRIEPYFINISKRIVKSPKIYIRDTGLLHALAGIENTENLEGFNGKGSSWEGFVIQQIVANLKNSVSYYFYRTQDGTELDLVLVKGLKPILGIEIKYSNAPKLSKGNKIASADLGDIPLLVVTPSVEEDYTIAENATVTNLDRLFEYLNSMKLLKTA